jgi:hypothetical protein
MAVRLTAEELAKYRIPDNDVETLQAPVADVRSVTPEYIEYHAARKTRPKALNLTCGRSECDQELHSFRPPKINLEATGPVPCTRCGFVLDGIDPSTIRESRDPSILFSMLQCEWIRHFFFHLPLTERIKRFALRKGRDGLIELAGEQLRKGRMMGYSPTWDPRQTAMLHGTIVHWARHAVACCCRRCIAYWHGIPMSATLKEEDIQYFQSLIVRYIALRMPNLPIHPERTPQRSSKNQLERMT